MTKTAEVEVKSGLVLGPEEEAAEIASEAAAAAEEAGAAAAEREAMECAGRGGQPLHTKVGRCKLTPGWKQLTPRLFSSVETKM